MDFISGSFVLFLCVLTAVYYLVPRRVQWIVLLCGSVFFYAFAGWRSLLYILLATGNTYTFALLLDKTAARQEERYAAVRDTLDKEARKALRANDKKKRARLLTVGLVIGIGLLCIPKYTGFVVRGVNRFGAGLTVPQLLLPMGLSFYTFQSVGYMIDVYWGKVKPQRNFARYALFVCFFPALIQGPISRYADVGEQLTAPHPCGVFFISKAAAGAFFEICRAYLLFISIFELWWLSCSAMTARSLSMRFSPAVIRLRSSDMVLSFSNSASA